MRVIFMGTPEFAVPSLCALADAGYDLVAACTQPDRPVGRGHKMEACPVKRAAEARGIPVLQFERVSRPEGLDALRALAPDVIITAAFGQILSRSLLAIPTYGVVNVHASLLPVHRGSAPIQWCVWKGDALTGITIMRTDAGIDTGDILAMRSLAIGPDENAETLSARLSIMGAELLAETLPAYLAGRIQPMKQDESRMTYDPMLTKAMGEIDWTQSARAIDAQVRGLVPWPGAYTEMAGGVLKLWAVRPQDDAFSSTAAPGTVLVANPREGLYVACGEGALEIREMQAPNSKRMTAKAYMMGKKIEVGTRFGK